MAGQERQQRSARDETPGEPETPGAPVAPAAQDTEVDSLLEEIDEVLESNAESFVRGFVQKGGQ